MKILLVAEFGLGSLGLSYCNAFKQMGCEVVKFDYVEEFKAANLFVAERYVNKLFAKFFYNPVNEKLLKATTFIDIDLVFVIKGIFIFPETLKRIKKYTKVPIFIFNPDNPFNLNRGASNDFIRESIPIYDSYFIWGKFLMPELQKAGAKNVSYLPFAYDPTLHYPINISDNEKNIYGSDLAFIGSWDEEREEWLKNLADYNLTIWGNSWNKLKNRSLLEKKWKGQPAIGEDFARICSASRIILNLVRRQNGNAHNMRTFEIPACKGFMLTTRTKEQCEFFGEGKDIACFDTPRELRLKLDQFLSNDNLRGKYRFNAHIKVKPHTYHERIKKILEVYELIKSK